MHVLYFTSGLLFATTIINQLNDKQSAWGFLIIPALIILAVAVILEHGR